MHARSGAMPEPQRDDHGVLTTAAIFDDAIYLSEALSLAANQSEDDYDADLALLASESGVEDPYRFLSSPHDISRALSTVTLDSDHRSSMSVHSQETQSTSFTSAPSRTSRDQIHTSERSPAPRTPPKVAQALATVEHHDQTIDAPLSNVKERHSSSTLSVSRSALSDSSSSSNPAPRRKRGSGLFGLFRKDSRYLYTIRVTVHSLINCVARAHRSHTMDITAKLEVQSWNAVIRFRPMQFAYTSRKRYKEVSKRHPAAAENLCHGKFWRSSCHRKRRND